MPIDSHPREYSNCPECGAGVAVADWQPERRLPQVGKTWACSNCGHEAHVYNFADPGESRRTKFKPVTQGMVVSLEFFDAVGEWPDGATEDLLLAGVDRAPAIDYHVVEREGVSQTEWAETTDRTQQAVSKNVAAAREALDE